MKTFQDTLQQIVIDDHKKNNATEEGVYAQMLDDLRAQLHSRMKKSNTPYIVELRAMWDEWEAANAHRNELEKSGLPCLGGLFHYAAKTALQQLMMDKTSIV